MPSQIVNAVPIRSSGWSIRAFASFITGGTPVATGTITSTPPYPVGAAGNTVNTTYVTGAHADVLPGMEVVFTDTATGAFKGRTHVTYTNAGAITAGSLPVREYAQANLNLVAGDTFKVYKEWRIHDKLVAALAGFPPDHRFYTDEGSNPPPVACSGGHNATKVDVGQTYATVLTTGGSYTVDPDSGGSVTHLWTLPTGVTFAPGSASTDATPTLRVNVGEYTVYHAVTDSSNSKTTVQHLYYKVHNAANPPHQILFTPDTTTADSGFGGSLQIVSGLTTQAAIPDGCLCIIWSEARNEALGSTASYRNTANGRAHILCIGIVRRDTQSGSPDGSRTVTFEVISPLARLKEIASYSKVMEEAASPDEWAEIKTLGVKRAIIQPPMFYTTVIEAGFDFTFDAAFIDYRYPAFYVQRSNFFDQIKELAEGVDARMVCDRTGRFNLHTDPRYIPLADRAAVTKTWNFIPRDVLSFDFPREHVDTVEKLKVSGFTGGASANSPLFSLYPGEAPGEGTDAPTRERLIVTDQDDLNARTGRYGAALDKVYQDADGLLYRAFPLTLVLRGVYDFFDFSKEYVNFTTSLARLARDVDLTRFLFCLQSTSVGYDFERGTATTTVVFDVVTNAAPGETFVPVDETTTLPPVLTPPEPYLSTPPAIGSLLGRGTANLVILSSDGNLYYVDVRTAENDFITPALSSTPLCFILNPFVLTDAAIATHTHAYRISDLFGTPSLGTPWAFRYSSGFRCMQSSRCTPGLFAVASHENDGAVDIDVSLDDGDTWTLAEQDLGGTWVGGLGDTIAPGMFASEHVAGKLIASAYAAGSTTDSKLYVSTDGAGASWSLLDANTMYNINPALTIPFPDGGDTTIYHGGSDGGGAFHLFKNVNGTATDVSPIVSGETYGPGDIVREFGVKVCDNDANTILLVGQNFNAGGAYKVGVFLSRDGAQSWQTLVTPGIPSVVLWRGCNIGSDRDNLWLWGDDGALAVSYDGGVTWKDLTIAGAGKLINIIGRAA